MIPIGETYTLASHAVQHNGKISIVNLNEKMEKGLAPNRATNIFTG